MSRRNLLEHLPWDGDLGHLEGDIAAVAHHIRADLDQLVLEGGQRPITHRFRRRQRAQEIAEVVGEGMKLEPHRVGGKRSARQSRKELASCGFVKTGKETPDVSRELPEADLVYMYTLVSPIEPNR
jgi:hypothetical protein